MTKDIAARLTRFLRARDGLARADYALVVLLVETTREIAMRHGSDIATALAPVIGGWA